MAIQRWDPLRDLLHLQQQVNHMFEEALARSGGSSGAEAPESAGWRPPVDLLEEADRYLLLVDLPGVAAGDVDIRVENDRLALRGERPLDPHVGREAYLRLERPHGRFLVQLALPPSVDPDRVRASHRHGVLEIVLPKRQESTAFRIEVSDG